MKLTSGVFLAFLVFPFMVLGFDFPTVPQNPENASSNTNVVAFPKPESETDLDFIAFPKPPINSENGDGVVSFPEPKDSALTATEFPKSIKDLSFKSRMELLADGFAPYEIEYDENGVCVSGCAYPGITIAEDMAAVDEATEEMADLIEKEETDTEDKETKKKRKPRIAKNWCQNGLSTKLPLRYPVDMTKLKYPITSDFGFRTQSANGPRFHPALDIGCPTGTPVYATADGVVRYAGNQTTPGGAGNWIGIEHANGLLTMYLHLSKILVKKGQTVSACDKIGLSGKSGNDINGNPYTGPHLDYRIRFDSAKNNYVDILCPCKASTKEGQGQTSNTTMSCAHSLFNAPYKFSEYNPNSDTTKRSLWRVKHGHCMKKNTDLLPDERRGELKTDATTGTITRQ